MLHSATQLCGAHRAGCTRIAGITADRGHTWNCPSGLAPNCHHLPNRPGRREKASRAAAAASEKDKSAARRQTTLSLHRPVGGRSRKTIRAPLSAGLFCGHRLSHPRRRRGPEADIPAIPAAAGRTPVRAPGTTRIHRSTPARLTANAACFRLSRGSGVRGRSAPLEHDSATQKRKSSPEGPRRSIELR